MPVCTQCGYEVYLAHGVFVDAWDEDEVCYDEDTNMLGDGRHKVKPAFLWNQQ